MDGFPRYELFGSKVARKFDYGIQDSKCGDPSQQQSKATKDDFWDGGDSSRYDDLHKVHLREKPDWLVTMSLPDIDELFGFYFRRSYDDYRTPGLANRDLALPEVSGCDSSECSHNKDADRRRKTLACLVLGIGALGILAGIIAVIFIMILNRPPDPITGGFVNITNPSHEGNYTTQRPSHDSDFYSPTQLSGLVTNTANSGTASTATLMFSPEFSTKALVTNNSWMLVSDTAPSAFTSSSLSGGMDLLLWTSTPPLAKTTAIFSETRIPEFSSTLQSSWRSLETGFAMTTSVTPTIGNTVDTLLPPGTSNTIITSVPSLEGSTVTTSVPVRNANTFTTPTTISLTTENTNTKLVTTTTTTGYTINISPIVTAAGKTLTLYPEDNTIITSAKLVSENTVITSAAMATANTITTSKPLTAENTHNSSVMANTIFTSPPPATRTIVVMSGSLATTTTNIISMPQVTENTLQSSLTKTEHVTLEATENTLVSSMPKITENTAMISTLPISQNTVPMSVPTAAVNAIVTLATRLSGDGSVTSSLLQTGNAIVTSTTSTTGQTMATSAAQMSLVPSTSVGGSLLKFSPLTSDAATYTPPHTTPTPAVTATPATVTLPVTLFSSDPGISEGIFYNAGFSGGMFSNSNLFGGLSLISTAVNTGLPAAATVTSSMSVTWGTVIDGSSGKSDVVLTLMSAVTGSSITTGTTTQRPDNSTVGAKDTATTTTATSGSPSLSSQISTTPSIVTTVTTGTVTPPTSPPVTLPTSTTGAKIVSLAPSTPGIAATPVVTTVVPSTVVLSVVTVVSEDRVTPAATATSTITITAPTQGTGAPSTKAAAATSTFMTTPAPTVSIFQSPASTATATTTTTTAVLPASQTSSSVTTSVPFISSAAVRATSSTASLTTSVPASTAGHLTTPDHSSLSSLGPDTTVSAALLPSTTLETMKVSDPATPLLPTTASATRVVPVSTNTATTTTTTTATTLETSAETNGIRQTMATITSHTSIAASTSTTMASSTTPNPTTIPPPIISPNRTTPPSTSNPTMFPSLLSTMPTLTKSLALTSTATSTTELTVPTSVLRTSSSLSPTFSTAVVVTTIISSSPPTTSLTTSSSSLALTSTSVTTPTTGVLTSTATLVTTTIPSTTTTPKSEIIFMDTVLQLYQPGVLSCTHIGNDWSFVVLLRNDTETIAGYQNVFGCTQMVGCNTFLTNVDLQETNVGFNNTFTLSFNNVSCSDQRLYTCQEVIVGLTASAFVKVEVPKSLQRLDISVPSTIRSSTPTSLSCSARLEAESGAVFWEIADPGGSTFVPIVLTGASQTQTLFDECLRDVTLRAQHTFSASLNGAKLRCRTIFPDAVSPEVVLNVV